MKSVAAVVTTSLVRKALAKVKTKTGLAIAAGLVLAGAGVGLARKYRTAH